MRVRKTGDGAAQPHRCAGTVIRKTRRGDSMNAWLRALVAALCLLLVGSAMGQSSYPDRPIRIVVPYPPGGGTDTLTRLVSKYMTESLKQPIVIENRPGADARIGMDIVTKAPADGYTLLAIAAGPLNEENMKSFVPIALFAAPAYLLVVNPQVKA